MSRGRGKVVFISSRAGVSPTAGLAVHSGTKHMLEAVAGALRQELSGTGVSETCQRFPWTGTQDLDLSLTISDIMIYQVSVSVCRPGGVNTPGYAHATEVELSAEARRTLGSWIPTDPSRYVCSYQRRILNSVYAKVSVCSPKTWRGRWWAWWS